MHAERFLPPLLLRDPPQALQPRLKQVTQVSELRIGKRPPGHVKGDILAESLNR